MAAADYENWYKPPKGDNTSAHITDTVLRVSEANRPPIGWYIAFALALCMLGCLGISIGWLFWTGIGIWGNMHPVAWAWDITNFVFWVGIGHAGTLISAILFLLRQSWRTAINRAAEAMTIFAVMCALIFPGIHIGRPWLPYWMLPIPNQMNMWPQFRSPLDWDVFAVSTYSRSRCSSGTSASSPTSRRSATARRRRSGGSCTASSRWAGAVRPASGTATRRRT
jgi:hypothetical protein